MIYSCTYALKLRKRRSTSRSTSSPSSFPVPLVSKTAPSVSLLWRFSSTSLPFLLSTSFQSRLTVPFLREYRACAVCETYEDNGRTREPLTSSMEGLAHARPNHPYLTCILPYLDGFWHCHSYIHLLCV